MAEIAVFVLTLIASTMLVKGFIATVREGVYSPGRYFSFCALCALFICRLTDAPNWVFFGNFAILLFTSCLWAHDLIKERA